MKTAAKTPQTKFKYLHEVTSGRTAASRLTTRASQSSSPKPTCWLNKPHLHSSAPTSTGRAATRKSQGRQDARTIAHNAQKSNRIRGISALRPGCGGSSLHSSPTRGLQAGLKEDPGAAAGQPYTRAICRVYIERERDGGEQTRPATSSRHIAGPLGLAVLKGPRKG